MADAEDKDRAKLAVLERFFETHADEIAESRLAGLEELAEKGPRLIVARDPVGADIVTYPAEEAFVKAAA